MRGMARRSGGAGNRPIVQPEVAALPANPGPIGPRVTIRTTTRMSSGREDRTFDVAVYTSEPASSFCRGLVGAAGSP